MQCYLKSIHFLKKLTQNSFPNMDTTCSIGAGAYHSVNFVKENDGRTRSPSSAHSKVKNS